MTYKIKDFATAFDRNYARCATVMLDSLASNSCEVLTVHILVPNTDIDTVEVAELQTKLSKHWNLDLLIYPIDNIQALKERELVRSVGYINETTYSKLFFQNHISKDIDNIVYLDPDVLILRDISPLANFGFNGQFAACVENKPWAQSLFGTQDMLYFNAGVFVASLKYFRDCNLVEAAIDYLVKRGQTQFMEQDILNFVMQGNFQVLPRTFNTFGDDFSHLNVLENLREPLIVHFAGGNKPWSEMAEHNPWTRHWLAKEEKIFGSRKPSLSNSSNSFTYFLKRRIFKNRLFHYFWQKVPLKYKPLIRNILNLFR